MWFTTSKEAGNPNTDFIGGIAQRLLVVIEESIEHYEDFCDNSDLDGKKYFNGKKVKKAKKVTVKYKDEDGSEKVYFYVVKYGSDWKIIDMDYDY